ncbi:MAG: DsrE/DsrF/DrsH-like family protein [Fibrobacter sp.]|uniref:DsrE/DsrF/DrsH-like family protein n=1 Tax=Fibrobacter sp. TaxID=35828 RepID=UPI001B02A84C|nr:DsrE/DsrF/DrsH-like family protein [Fibrobacter sp.]MBO7062306.1 DsrE/DsrF/DrsH-like family protein [Fibrobacter sp.]
MSEVKNFPAKDFYKIDLNNSTLLDVREPSEAIVRPVNGAVQVPFFELSKKVDSIPKDKPVYVFCSTGDRSEQVAEILADRDYDVHNVEGGLDAVPKVHFVDAKGLKCPGPIVQVDEAVKSVSVGEEVQVEATEKAFRSDVEVWCQRTGNELKLLSEKDGVIYATVVKRDAPVPEKREFEHGKTFVVFSGDLDKAIASFIMANGAAAMGRPVTMFFTFWGVSLLRRPEKVRVKKSFIGKMFSIMLPRGSKKLGLSRMNFGGIGAKMIRAVMKQNGVSSLEELIENARQKGVKFVACQMSMELMGITAEELIDGVELGGVATMLGSTEKSDLTYFI